MFDLLRTRHREGSTTAPIPQEPPRFREQLRVGGITSVNLHLECSPFGVRARKPHDAALTGELRELAHVDTARRQRGANAIQRRRPGRRAPNESDDRGQTEAHAESGEHSGQRAEVKGDRGDHGADDRNESQPADRSHHVRSSRHHDRRHDRDPQHRKTGFGSVDRAFECLPRPGRRASDQQAHERGRAARHEEITYQPRAVSRDHGHHDDEHHITRREQEERPEERLRPVRQVPQEL